MAHAIKQDFQTLKAPRRTLPRMRRAARSELPTPYPVSGPLTLGDLIAAAFDTVGNELKDVARVITSPVMKRSLGRCIVLVP